MVKEKILMQRTVEIEIPRLPNFIKAGEEYRSLKEFSVEEIKEIGAKWTQALLDLRKRKLEQRD